MSLLMPEAAQVLIKRQWILACWIEKCSCHWTVLMADCISSLRGGSVLNDSHLIIMNLVLS